MINLYTLEAANSSRSFSFEFERDQNLPRDKTVTNAKIIQYMKEEFLEYGFEKASLNRVSAKVGITTAGLYKHFDSKEDMFSFLVKDTLDDFYDLTTKAEKQMDETESYNPFQSDWATAWADFIYEHYTGVKLLICCSVGSKYESFEDDLIEMETEGNKAYAKALRKTGKVTKNISDMQWHILSTSYVHLLFEAVRHDMTKEEALDHMRFVAELLYPGWKQLLGIE